MIRVFWGARHGQGVTSLVAHVAAELENHGSPTLLVDADTDVADLVLWGEGQGRGDLDTLDALAEEAEVSESVAWPLWAPWHGKTRILPGNARRPVPLAVSHDAARRIWHALQGAATESDVLVDAGSGLRDYLPVRLIADADHLVVVTRAAVPDVVMAQNALQYVGARISAARRTLVVIGSGAGSSELAERAQGFEIVTLPYLDSMNEARNSGRVLRSGGRSGSVAQYLQGALGIVGEPTQDAAKGRRRSLWLRR